MNAMGSACGLECSACSFYPGTCGGCAAVKGSTFWAQEAFPNKTCPLYDCAVNTHRSANCGGCAELPCRTFYAMKDPNASEEEHLRSITARVSRLKGIQ